MERAGHRGAGRDRAAARRAGVHGRRAGRGRAAGPGAPGRRAAGPDVPGRGGRAERRGAGRLRVRGRGPAGPVRGDRRGALGDPGRASCSDTALDRFGDGSGGFYDTADDSEALVYRPADPADGPTPSGRVRRSRGAAQLRRADRVDSGTGRRRRPRWACSGRSRRGSPGRRAGAWPWPRRCCPGPAEIAIVGPPGDGRGPPSCTGPRCTGRAAGRGLRARRRRTAAGRLAGRRVPAARRARPGRRRARRLRLPQLRLPAPVTEPDGAARRLDRKPGNFRGRRSGQLRKWMALVNPAAPTPRPWHAARPGPAGRACVHAARWAGPATSPRGRRHHRAGRGARVGRRRAAGARHRSGTGPGTAAPRGPAAPVPAERPGACGAAGAARPGQSATAASQDVAPLGKLLRADVLVVSNTALPMAPRRPWPGCPGVQAARAVDAARIQVNGKFVRRARGGPVHLPRLRRRPRPPRPPTVAQRGERRDRRLLHHGPAGQAAAGRHGPGHRADRGGPARSAGFGTVGIGGVDAVVSDPVARSLGFPAGNAIVVSAPHARSPRWSARSRPGCRRGTLVEPLVTTTASGRPAAAGAWSGAVPASPGARPAPDSRQPGGADSAPRRSSPC